MERTKKTVLKGFSYRNSDDFAAYLNHMARQGWHFQQWRAGLIFEKGEPEESVYAVEVFTRAEEGDIRPLPETAEFAEYCHAAGWEFVDAWRKFVVFKKIRPDAVPILTAEERFENIVKSERHGILQPLIIAAIWCLMQLFQFGTMFPFYIFSPLRLMLSSVWIVLFAAALIRFLHFLLWQRRCRKRLEDGRALFFGRTRADKWYAQFYTLVIALLCGAMFLIGQPLFGIVMLFITATFALMAFIIGKLRPDSTTNALIQTLGGIAIVICVLFMGVFAQDIQEQRSNEPLSPPLTFRDFGIDTEIQEIHYSREEETIFGKRQYANLDYGPDYLFYSIYTTDIDWVLDKLWQEETEGKVNDVRTDCTAAWGAEEAFRNNAGHYLVRYRDALWVINPSLEEPLTQAQIDAIIHTLREG